MVGIAREGQNDKQADLAGMQSSWNSVVRDRLK